MCDIALPISSSGSSKASFGTTPVCALLVLRSNRRFVLYASLNSCPRDA